MLAAKIQRKAKPTRGSAKIFHYWRFALQRKPTWGYLSLSVCRGWWRRQGTELAVRGTCRMPPVLCWNYPRGLCGWVRRKHCMPVHRCRDCGIVYSVHWQCFVLLLQNFHLKMNPTVCRKCSLFPLFPTPPHAIELLFPPMARCRRRCFVLWFRRITLPKSGKKESTN